MSEVTPAPAAPGGDGGAPAPAPAPTPAPAPAPAAPAQPSPAPATPPAQPQLSAEEQAAKAEDDEWDAAAKEVFPGLKSANKEGDKNEPTKPQTTTETSTQAQGNPNGEEPNAEPGAGDDTGQQGEEDKGDGNGPENPDDPAAAERASRAAARYAAQQSEAVRSDVREKMFPDLPKTLVDADGDPINSIEDVMRLINPRTNENFTEEEAGMWLLHAQQQFNKKMEEINQTVEQIADLHLDMKDQADNINARYGAWLKANPEKRDAIWAEYEKTLVKDPNSGLIVHTPVNMEWFYDQTVGPQMAAAPVAPAAAPAAPGNPETPPAPQETPEQKAQREADEAAEAERKRKQKQADRSDVFGGANTDTRDDEDKEWDEALENVYPHLKNQKK